MEELFRALPGDSTGMARGQDRSCCHPKEDGGRRAGGHGGRPGRGQEVTMLVTKSAPVGWAQQAGVLSVTSSRLPHAGQK